MRPVLRSLWLSYLEAEQNGYRPRSLTALAELLDAVTSVADRDDVALVAFRTDELRHESLRLRDPLKAQVLQPFVRDYFAEPRVIWWALHTYTADHELLETYGHYDRVGGDGMAGAITYAVAVTGEPRWWRLLLAHRVGIVEYATHHLDEGHGLVGCDVVDCVLQVAAAVGIVDQAPAGVIGAVHREELALTWLLVRDWARYDAAARPGDDFPRWCREQGSDHWVARHTGTRHYYYR